MNDRLERYIEVILALGITGGTFYGVYAGHFSGQEGTILIMGSMALYQSTSLAKIFSIFRSD